MWRSGFANVIFRERVRGECGGGFSSGMTEKAKASAIQGSFASLQDDGILGGVERVSAKANANANASANAGISPLRFAPVEMTGF